MQQCRHSCRSVRYLSGARSTQVRMLLYRLRDPGKEQAHSAVPLCYCGVVEMRRRQAQACQRIGQDSRKFMSLYAKSSVHHLSTDTSILTRALLHSAIVYGAGSLHVAYRMDMEPASVQSYCFRRSTIS